MQSKGKINPKDIAEMLFGAVALGYPLAVTEEVWDLGETLPWPNALWLWLGSGVVIGWYSTHAFQDGLFRQNWGKICMRVLVVQALTFAVCAMILGLFGKWPITTDPEVAIKRTLIVLYPAAFAATIVDSLDDD